MPAIDTIQSYAKINLILQVAPPITDPSDPNCGMHPICSWMHAINIADEITIEQSAGTQSAFDIRWSLSKLPVEWEASSDLMVRAHALLESEVGRSLPIKLTARKNIPAGGGLGGGSSNAAGVFMGLNDLFELGYDELQLQAIALKLGSDIPFFIDFESHRVGIPTKSAVVSGIGNQIHRTPRHSDRITLLIPKFGCSTKEVYKALDDLGSTRTLDFDSVYEAANTKRIKPWELKNDLAEPAMVAQPELRRSFELLGYSEVYPLLSGSGSTMFVVGRPMSSWVSNFRKVLSDMFTIEVTSLT